jgi:hypothetical protein
MLNLKVEACRDTRSEDGSYYDSSKVLLVPRSKHPVTSHLVTNQTSLQVLVSDLENLNRTSGNDIMF